MNLEWFRTDQEEILDREGTSPRGREILDDLDRWNRLAGWYIFHVRRIKKHWEALGCPEPVRILDIGTGPAGLLDAIAKQFAKDGISVDLVGVDLHSGYVEMARERMGERAEIVQADATDLPYDDHSFDIGANTLMMHHLPQEVRQKMVTEIGRVCRSAYIFDLMLSLPGYMTWAIASTLMRMDTDTRHDGLVSSRRACSFSEFEVLVEPLPVKAGTVIPFTMHTEPV